MVKAKKIAVVGGECVACGCCEKVCLKGAIHVHLGIIAQVNREACVGCGQCAKVCPAAVITVLDREASQ